MVATKVCFKCDKDKPLTEYYKHKQMGDGHLNKCKDCTKKDTKERLDFNLKNVFGFHEMEKARHRDKYYRLGYKEKHKKTSEESSGYSKNYRLNYPEKYKAKIASQRLPKNDKNNHLHHWSYNEQHWKDCIELTTQDHYFLHRFIKYDQSEMMYRNKNGELLNTKQSHIDLLEYIKANETL